MRFPAQSGSDAFFSPFASIRLARVVLFALMAVFLLAGCGLGSATATGGDGSSSAALTPTQRPAYIFVAIGASETFGTGADRPATQNWPTDLSSRLPRGTQVVNLGIPGITAPEAVLNELPEALDAQPNLVTVWLGTNDIVDQVSLGDYQQSLDSILGQLQRQTRARVAVANIPDLTLLPRFNSYDQKELQGIVGQWNQVVKQEIAAHGDILLDVYSHTSEVLGNPDYLSGDGLHPSTQGYQQIAALFYQVLHKNGVI
jgi:lysophospholipase L1-like esterase